MRKTLGICVAASLALWLGGCGDDDAPDCIESCEEGDASGTGTESQETESDTETSEDSGTPSTTAVTSSSADESDAGSSSTPNDAGTTSVAPDDGGSEPDSSTTETDADVIEEDGGPTADAGDAATQQSDAATDTEDGSAPVLSACDQACATATEVGCAEPCGTVCGIRNDSLPDCLDEADVYLECVGAADPSTDFVCDGDSPTYIGDACNDALFVWLDCMNAQG